MAKPSRGGKRGATVPSTPEQKFSKYTDKQISEEIRRVNEQIDVLNTEHPNTMEGAKRNWMEVFRLGTVREALEEELEDRKEKNDPNVMYTKRKIWAMSDSQLHDAGVKAYLNSRGWKNPSHYDMETAEREISYIQMRGKEDIRKFIYKNRKRR